MEDEAPLKAALAGRYQIEREIGSEGMATGYLPGSSSRFVVHVDRFHMSTMRPA